MKINLDNYHSNTFAIFKGCKKPNRQPDYISENKYTKYKDAIIHINEIKSFITKKHTLYYYINKQGINYLENKLNGKIVLINKNSIHIPGDFITINYIPFSSSYWYGEDKKGKYVIRHSDHWSEVQDFKQKRYSGAGCSNIATCVWILKTTDDYSNFFIKIHTKYSTGKCYLKDFKNVDYANKSNKIDVDRYWQRKIEREMEEYLEYNHY